MSMRLSLMSSTARLPGEVPQLRGDRRERTVLGQKMTGVSGEESAARRAWARPQICNLTSPRQSAHGQTTAP